MHSIVKHKKPVIGSDEDDHSDDSLETITGKPRVVQARKRITSKKSAIKRSMQLNSDSSKSKRSKKDKQSKKAVPKLMKTLRDDEEAGNIAFAEKILVEDGFYFCKVCKKMSTASKMRARCHAVSCGKSKKKSRFRKLSPCLLCDQVFGSKKVLSMHHRKVHMCVKYTCSTCLKSFTLRQNYRRHVLGHQKQTQFRCSQCGKVFPSQFNLKRHIKTHHKESEGSVPDLHYLNSYFEETQSTSGTEVLLTCVFM